MFVVDEKLVVKSTSCCEVLIQGGVCDGCKALDSKKIAADVKSACESDLMMSAIEALLVDGDEQQLKVGFITIISLACCH